MSDAPRLRTRGSATAGRRGDTVGRRQVSVPTYLGKLGEEAVSEQLLHMLHTVPAVLTVVRATHAAAAHLPSAPAGPRVTPNAATARPHAVEVQRRLLHFWRWRWLPGRGWGGRGEQVAELQVPVGLVTLRDLALHTPLPHAMTA